MAARRGPRLRARAGGRSLGEGKGRLWIVLSDVRACVRAFVASGDGEE